ncbi:MAG TPA: TonB-dependent receptor [Saprospiraceae bacterium]|nr:TonB-dependent receptor [Saprospiraceae bacterium]
MNTNHILYECESRIKISSFSPFLGSLILEVYQNFFKRIADFQFSIRVERIFISDVYNHRYSFCKLVLCLGIILLSDHSVAQVPETVLSAVELKKLSMEELMNIEVTSVSKHPENLQDAASAIQVISALDIRNSGAKTIAEALRLASNLQVAQVNSSQWAISARGFNNVLANKLLVLIDGRTVYTPLYAGVFWDVQNLMLENVEQIEVISGPGGTLWGANAVNGVINIITKSAKNTKGLFIEGATGTDLSHLGSIRYGGNLNSDLSYRIFGTGFKMRSSILTTEVDAEDEWSIAQGGCRLDWDASANNKFIFSSNIYSSRPNPDGDTTAIFAKGSNAIARWNHLNSEKSDFQIQAYYDHTWRDFNNGFTEDLKTYDIDGQNRYQINEHQVLTYGVNFRMMDHQVTNLELFAFLPGHKMLYLSSLFLQYEVAFLKERLHFTIGSKIEHNSYTGLQYLPNSRISWTPTSRQTIWAAVSRAVRNPARIDRDFYLYLAPNLPFISGSNSSLSEKIIAYELGWRMQPAKLLSVSLSTFYNVYDNIRSAEPGPPPFNIPITFANGVHGVAYGVELSATYHLRSWWNFRGGYTFLKKNLSVKPESKDLNEASAESDDPENQFLIQSTIDLPGNFHVGTVLRYVDKLPKPYVRSYSELDARISWNWGKNLELSVAGQNLLHVHHAEFIPSSPSPREIQRSIYGKIACQF